MCCHALSLLFSKATWYTHLNLMEFERRALQQFLAMHAHKASPTQEPAVHLQFYSDTMAAGAPLLKLTEDDIKEELNVESELVRRLLRQLHTYDCRTQRIVGLIFGKDVVLSEVLRCSN